MCIFRFNQEMAIFELSISCTKTKILIILHVNTIEVYSNTSTLLYTKFLDQSYDDCCALQADIFVSCCLSQINSLSNISFGTSSAFLNDCPPFLFSLIIVLYEQLLFSQCSKPYNGTIITAWFTNIFT